MVCDIKVPLESAPGILGGFVLLGKIGHGVPDPSFHWNQHSLKAD